ncbi:MAG: dihydropteroate synthase [Rhodoglobus sp.]
MGILNVTPDSFSDGGQFEERSAAVAHGVEMRDQGATLVDVGGESTRPGAHRVDPAEEQRRVLPVISELVAEGVPVSVDTMNAETARAAAGAGASVINDVSGGLADPGMYRAVAETGLTYVAMHWRDLSHDMDAVATYGDVVADVRGELTSRLAELTAAGVRPERVILDPGLGFAKRPEHNWQLLARLDEVMSLGHPVLIGASRKRFLAPWGAQPAQRDEATAIVSALAARAGVWGVRVHDVAATRAALEIAEMWKTGETPQ